MHFRDKLDITFRQFADLMKADDGYLEEGINLCNNVLKEIEANSQSYGFSVHSTHYSGSIGKKTELQKPDFDIVIKMKHLKPPFENVLKYFKTILLMQIENLSIKPKSIKLTKFSIQFSFNDGKEVDLLPAMADLLPTAIHRKMRMHPEMQRYYNSSLVEEQVQFMKDQKEIAHTVVRLAKYWYKSMDVGGRYVSGGSLIFELLAVAAVLEGRGPEERFMLNCFYRLVEMVEKFDELEITFKKYESKWRVRQLLHDEHKIPYVVEPANPTNNLLHGMKKKVIQIFKKNGRVMKHRIDCLLYSREFCKTNRYDGNVEIDFKRLFACVSIEQN